MDSNTLIAVIVLIIGIVTLILLGAAEAGVIAGVRERALREPAESRVEALRRFYQERQVTLSSLSLARNLASVAVTGVATYLVLREATDAWPALAVTIVLMAVGFVLLQGFTRTLVARDPHFWQRITWPLVVTIRFLFKFPVLMLDAPLGALMHAWHRSVRATEAEEELLLVAEMEEASAALPDAEREMIRGVMDLEFTAVREVMVPRTDIISIEVDSSFEDLARLMVEKGVSRIPVYEEDIDHILGIAHSKEVMRHLVNGANRPPIREIVREPYTVPEVKKVQELLSEMRGERISIAIVVDEYGGTAGLVTLEDLIEEIVGEIQDEYDQEEQSVQQVSEGEAILDARVSIDELNEMFDTDIEKEDFDSVGGFIVNELGRMPSVGDTVNFDGVSLKVLSVAGRRIKKVRVQKVAAPEQTKNERERTMTDGARFHNPDTVHKPVGYSHVAEVTSGRLVYLSGQVSVDQAGNIVGVGDIAAQTRRVFENIRNNLAAVGADFSNVIKMTYYVVDRAGVPAIREIRNEYVNTASPPASTLVFVSGLVREEWLIEIEAIALVS